MFYADFSMSPMTHFPWPFRLSCSCQPHPGERAQKTFEAQKRPGLTIQSLSRPLLRPFFPHRKGTLMKNTKSDLGKHGGFQILIDVPKG